MWQAEADTELTLSASPTLAVGQKALALAKRSTVLPFGPPMWQAEADTELSLSASLTTAVGQMALDLAKRRYSTVSSTTTVYLFTVSDYQRNM